jgi:hypothetical protein
MMVGRDERVFSYYHDRSAVIFANSAFNIVGG